MESCRQFVLPFSVWRISRPAACVGYELAPLVMNRNCNAPSHEAFFAIAYSELLNGLLRESPRGKIRMIGVKMLEREAERRVLCLFCFFLRKFLRGWVRRHFFRGSCTAWLGAVHLLPFAKPFLKFERCCSDIYTFHLS